MRCRLFGVFVILVSMLVSCDSNPASEGSDGGGQADATTLVSRCNEGSSWSEGIPIYREATDAWGLSALRVIGARINVLDLENDGFPDLLIRSSAEADDFASGERTRWLLRNNGAGQFEDVTESSGLFARRDIAASDRASRPGEVLAAGDVDNDGDVDVFVAASVTDLAALPDRSELMLNRGDGTFEFGPFEDEIRSQQWPTHVAGVSFTDADRDGYLDVWVVQNMLGGTSSALYDVFYRGLGGVRFSDVTESLGLSTIGWGAASAEDHNQARTNSWGWSSAACDLNNDGVPDLLASSYGRRPNHLWQGVLDGDGTLRFENRSVDSGYAYDARIDWSDNESARCFCRLNRSAEGCDGVPEPRVRCERESDILRWNHAAGREAYNLGGNSGSTTCADLDNDGDLDLLTGEIVHWDVGANSDPAELLFNRGEAEIRFERPGNEETGLTRTQTEVSWDEGIMTQAVFDFDNDGWPDVYFGNSDYPGTRGLLYRQDSPGHFTSVAVMDFFEHFRSHGVVSVDLDRDGDLDLVVGNSRMRCSGDRGADCYDEPRIRIFENIVGDRGNWVQLTLEGTAGTNRSAIGARVRVTAGDLTQTQEVDGGHGHYGSQNDLTLHFGLGAECEAEVTVRWPNVILQTQTFRVQTGYRYQIRQGDEPRAQLSE